MHRRELQPPGIRGLAKTPDQVTAPARLDREEAEAQCVREPDGVPADVAVGYLCELGTTGRTAHGGPGRRVLAEALFERIEGKGLREITG